MKLFHCSDIQVRPLNRHDEFKSVFDKFYTSLIAHGAYDQDNSIIVVCGDIVQEKDKLKPETFMILRRFFEKLVLISGCVVVICGNHDLLENNKERLDNLTPILYRIKGVHYLKKTGEYLIKGVNFVVNSIFDNKFIKEVKGAGAGIKNIGLYHGMLNGSIFNNGMVVRDKGIKVSDFKQYDYVLLGDIHKHQYMDADKRIAYSGSLVQQNFGEPYNGHGYMIWNLDKNKNISKFIEIKSDYGFYNIKSIEDVAMIQSENAYIKYHVKNKEEIEIIKKDIEAKCTVLEERINILTNDNELDANNFDFIEQCQNNDLEFVKKQLDYKNIPYNKKADKAKKEDDEDNEESEEEKEHKTEPIKLELGDKIIAYHKNLRKKIEIGEGHGIGGYWTLDYMEFKNMLIYGGGYINKITFKDGVISICGDNAIGKSCILKLVIFALFDKTCSNNKNSILNKREDKCFIELRFSFSGNGGDKYILRRVSETRKNKEGIIIEVRFKNTLTKIDAKNNIDNINADNQSATMTYLRQFLGGYEDFIMTNVFSHSYNDISLLKITDKARLEVFNRYFKLDIYNMLKDACKKELKDLNDKWNLLKGKLEGLTDVENCDEIKKQIKSLKLDIKNKTTAIINDNIISEKKYNEIKSMDIIKCKGGINVDELAVMKNRLGDFNGIWDPNDDVKLAKLYDKSFNEIGDVAVEVVNYKDIKYTDITEIDAELYKDNAYRKYSINNLDTLQENLYELKMQIIDIGEEQEWTDVNEKRLKALWNDSFTGMDIHKVKIWQECYEANKSDYEQLKTHNRVFKEFIEGREGEGPYDVIDKWELDELICELRDELSGKYDEIKKRIWKSGGKLDENINNDCEQFIKWYEMNELKKQIEVHAEIHKKNKEILEKISFIECNIRYNKLLKLRKSLVYQKYLEWKALKNARDNVALAKQVREMECKLRYIQIKDYEANIGKLDIEKKINDLERKKEESCKAAIVREELMEIEGSREVLEIYKEIVDKNGIPFDILNDKIKNIGIMINRFLMRFVEFEISIIITDSKFEMSVNKKGISMGIGDLSGYETFILNIAFKNALLKLSKINKCGCLFIDEGLDCIDINNFERLGDVFEDLGKVFKQIIVITHIADIRRFEKHNIQIMRDAGGNSQIKLLDKEI